VVFASNFKAQEERSYWVSCTKDRILFKQGQAPSRVYILQIGEGFLTMKSDSCEVVMRRHALSGSVLGLPAVITGNRYSLTATVEGGSVVRIVTYSDFQEMLELDPSLLPAVLQVLASEVRAARQALAVARDQRPLSIGPAGANSSLIT
jgi:CRP-like cAMP-binding protein